MYTFISRQTTLVLRPRRSGQTVFELRYPDKICTSRRPGRWARRALREVLRMPYGGTSKLLQVLQSQLASKLSHKLLGLSGSQSGG